MSEKGKRTFLITGGASGMGKLLAERCLSNGDNVAAVDFNSAALEAFAADGTAYGNALATFCADVRDYSAVERVCAGAVERFGSIDVLVPFAGGAETRIRHASGKFWEIPIDVYDFGIDVNLKGAFYFDHAVMKYMMEQESGGVIVHIGSITGEEGSGSAVAYSASKSALMNGLTKSVAIAGDGKVRCVCVAPGPVLTRPGMAKMKTLAGRAADPCELVDMILYAASDKAAFWNGSTLLMDGGRNVMLNKG